MTKKIFTFNKKKDRDIFNKLFMSPPTQNKQQLHAYEFSRGNKMGRTIKITPTAPQLEFHQLSTRFNLFVAGFGAGKTRTLIDTGIIDASISSKAVVALYAPTYDLVRLILAQRMVERLNEYGISHTYNKTHNEIYTSAPGFGDFVMRTLDKPERIVGYQAYSSHIDELDTLPTEKAREAWQKVVGRTRQKIEDIDKVNKVCAYTTPEGYRFAYQQWVKEKNADYGMVQAPSYSNPMLPADYIQGLRDTYPAELVEAYIEGKFVNLSGGNVYSSYNRATHNSSETIVHGETLRIGCDFNVTKQAATVYVTRKGGEEWHAVAELIDMYDTPEMINLINSKWPEHKIIIYPDASGRSRKTTNASISDISLLQQAKFEVRAHNTNPRVKDRVMAMNGALSKGLLYINASACPTVARCLEQQAYDKNGEPDKKSGHDHQNDATTYPIAYELPIKKPVAHIPMSFSRQ